MRSYIHQFDLKLTAAIQRLPAEWQPVVAVLTHMGHPVVVILIGAAIVLTGRWIGNSRLLVAGACIPATLLVGSLIKLIFSRARPMTEYAAMIKYGSSSFPSGHALGATVAYGLLAMIAWHYLPTPWAIAATILCAIIIVFVGVSRVYLGAHYPTDVLAGWLIGSAALLFIHFVVKPFGTS